MPDITMCTNKKCKRAKTCYRVTAKPSDYQYYSNFDEKDCERYWDNRKEEESCCVLGVSIEQNS